MIAFLAVPSRACPRIEEEPRGRLLPRSRFLGQSQAPIKARFRGQSPRVDRRGLVSRIVVTNMAASPKTLITFDVDGTLLKSIGAESNKLHKSAFSHAFKEVFGIEGTIESIKVSRKHHGSTDKLVAMNTLEFYGIPKELSEPRIEEIVASMLRYASQEALKSDAAEGLELLPGVRSLLEALSNRDDVIVGLVTGNLEDIGWIKMKALGIYDLFSSPHFGGFGSDHTDRGELVKIARQRALDRFPGIEVSLHAHVGDTPNDIIAAQNGGARPVGVCTGIFSEKQLSSVVERTDAVVLDDLASLDAFYAACGLNAPLERSS